MSRMRLCGVCGRSFLYDNQSLYKFNKYHDRPSMVCCSYSCYMEEKHLREGIHEKIKQDLRDKARKKSK